MTPGVRAMSPRGAARPGRTDGSDSAGRSLRALDWAAPLLLAVLHLGLGLLVFDPTPHTGGDNAAYITLARSLLERGAYLELYDPAAAPHTLYPPVFPALLALAMAAGVKPWVGLKLLVLFCSVAAVVLAYLWMRRRSGPRLALGVGLALAISPGVLELGHWVLSDVPFWAFSMLALWAFESTRPGERRHFAIAIAAVVLAYFTRSAGLPLMVAAALGLAIGRRWKALAVLAGVVIPLGALWWIRGRMAGAADYIDQFWLLSPYQPELGRIGAVDLGRRIADNIGRYVGWHLPRLAVGRGGGLPMAFGIGLLTAAVAGWLTRLRRPGMPELFLPFYLGLILVWPEVWSGERFLLPVLPLILVYAAEAVAAGGRRLRPAAAVAAGIVALAGFVGLAAPALLVSARGGMACTAAYRAGERYPCVDPEWHDYFALAEWARGALPEDAVVITRKPRLFHFLSGRPARVFPYSDDPGEFFALIDEIGADFLVLDQVDGLSAAYLTPVLVRRPAAFCFVRTEGTGRATLFGIARDWAAIPDRSDAPTAGEASVAFRVCPAD